MWTSVMPRAMGLIMQCVYEHFPSFPEACRLNCHYEVSMPSLVFQCTPNPPSLPYAQVGIPQSSPGASSGFVLWNVTRDPIFMWGFYVTWNSNGADGTSGNTSCSPIQAQYNISVQIIALST